MDPFVYLPAYRLVICQRCRFACVADETATHLQKRHPEIPPAERCRIVSVVKGINKIIRRQSDLENFKFPPPTTEPISYLEPPRSDGMKCRTCPHIACQIQKIQAHCRKKHNWINPRKKGRQPALQPLNQDEVPWTEGVLCQRFFRSRAASGWFEVGRGHTHPSQMKVRQPPRHAERETETING